MRVFKDMHQETRDSKYSSKKIWGSVIMALVCVAFVSDGFHFYQTDHVLFNSMLIAGTTLVGLNTLNGLVKPSKPSKPSKEVKPKG